MQFYINRPGEDSDVKPHRTRGAAPAEAPESEGDFAEPQQAEAGASPPRPAATTMQPIKLNAVRAPRPTLPLTSTSLGSSTGSKSQTLPPVRQGPSGVDVTQLIGVSAEASVSSVGSASLLAGSTLQNEASIRGAESRAVSSACS